MLLDSSTSWLELIVRELRGKFDSTRLRDNKDKTGSTLLSLDQNKDCYNKQAAAPSNPGCSSVIT